MDWIKALFRRKPEYIYGYANPKMKRARKHRKTGRVEMVFWNAGEQGHQEDYWHPIHEYWWPSFTTETPIDPATKAQ